MPSAPSEFVKAAADTMERVKQLRDDVWLARRSAKDTREAAQSVLERATAARKKAEAIAKRWNANHSLGVSRVAGENQRESMP